MSCVVSTWEGTWDRFDHVTADLLPSQQLQITVTKSFVLESYFNSSRGNKVLHMVQISYIQK